MISDGLAQEMLEAQEAIEQGVFEAVALMADPALVAGAIHADCAVNVIYECVSPRHGHAAAVQLCRMLNAAATCYTTDADEEVYEALRDGLALFLARRFDLPRHDSN